MRTIIKQSFSDMLDELLEKALEEKPEFINKERVNYECLFIDYDRKRDNIFITFPAYSRRTERTTWTQYQLDLTPHQKELINKIFQRWGDNANGNL